MANLEAQLSSAHDNGTVRKQQKLKLLSTLSGTQTLVYGTVGALLFFGLWEVAHIMTAEEAKRFLPSPFAVLQALYTLIVLGMVFLLEAVILDNTEADAKELIEAAQTIGTSRREIVHDVVGQAAWPAIVDSMRNMIAVSYTYLVIAEIVAAQDGIGAVMMRARRFLKVDVIMAGILAIGIMGVLTDIIFRVAAHYAFPWNRKRKG